jgi:3D (Asp-Asp-Asp) domain-containing protein
MLRVLFAAALLAVAGCASVRPSVPPPTPTPAPAPEPLAREFDVTASAYNSTVEQTDGHPQLTASGETLRPGLRALAVSDDLFEAGLDFGTRVEIEGMPGEWIVMDRMHSRWKRKIDVYMGVDRDGALRFGEKRVKIRWQPPEAVTPSLPSGTAKGG